MKIHILHMNDMHSQMENQMRVGRVVRELRDEFAHAGEPVLTFDIGDVLDRVRPETEATLGRLNAHLLGTLGVDGWVFGNNEGLTIPVQYWPDLVLLSETHVFGTNIRYLTGDALPGFADYQIYHLSGVRIGVFGVTPAYEKPYEHLGVSILSPEREAARVVELLKVKGCDIILALSHLGLRADHELAQAVPAIDVILGGHTHQFMKSPVMEGRTTIFQVGKHGLAFGHTILTLDDALHELKSVTGCLIYSKSSWLVDADMATVYRSYQPVVNEYLDTPITSLDTPLSTSLTTESGFANLLAEVLWREYTSDCGIVVSGLLGASLLSGMVCKRHIHAACSTPTRPVLVTLTGRELWDTIERGLQPEFALQRGFGFGFRGSVVGYPGLANVQVQGRQDDQGRVYLEHLSIGGVPVELTQDYRVITVEYLWLASVLPEIHQGREIDIPAPLVRDLLMTGIPQAEFVQAGRMPHIDISIGEANWHSTGR